MTTQKFVLDESRPYFFYDGESFTYYATLGERDADAKEIIESFAEDGSSNSEPRNFLAGKITHRAGNDSDGLVSIYCGSEPDYTDKVRWVKWYRKKTCCSLIEAVGEWNRRNGI